MTPKEKANELVNKYSTITKWKMGVEQEYVIKRAKECALIAVDEIIKAHIHNEGVRHLKWWEEVKQEIEKL
jgi:hypothetical protein